PTGAQLRWRVLMILILLAAVAVPLSSALFQVARETLARGAVQDELKRLVPSAAVVSQQVSVGRNEIAIRLISTTPIPDTKVAQVRQDLMRRTGRDVQISVDAVASKRELADLMEHLAQPAPVVVAKEKTLDEMKKELLNRVDPAIREIWPSSDAPIQDYDMVLAVGGVVINIRYQATKDLGEIPVDMVQ
ncbi:MAG: hypothetical protein WBW33_24845, partial [Bryobacteraceae bacterium]